MRIEGRWLRFPDGVERPVIEGHLRLPGGQFAAVSLVIDKVYISYIGSSSG